MNSLAAAAAYLPKYPVTQCAKPRRVGSGLPPVISALKTSPPPMKGFSGDDVLRDFLREREVSGDFIAKLCDELWLKKGSTVNSENVLDLGGIDDVMEEPGGEGNENGGFLKLKQNSEWLLGDSNSVPLNKKMVYKDVLDDGERRKRLNFLRYEALKRELLLLTVGIGTACTGYCLVALSVQAGASYAVGVVFSCLYFQLLCKHADNISSDIVPQIFTKKRTKRIGIRSEDLQDAFERSVKGASIALSSPRLVIPAAIYGFWEFSQHFSHNLFDFQLVPAMVGLFAYKAAALVQLTISDKLPTVMNILDREFMCRTNLYRYASLPIIEYSWSLENQDPTKEYVKDALECTAFLMRLLQLIVSSFSSNGRALQTPQGKETIGATILNVIKHIYAKE